LLRRGVGEAENFGGPMARFLLRFPGVRRNVIVTVTRIKD